MYLRDRIGRPVAVDDVESLKDVGDVVIDKQFSRWIISIADEGSTYCSGCAEDDCNHTERVERALRDHGLLERSP
jgi:hypothetical protein